MLGKARYSMLDFMNFVSTNRLRRIFSFSLPVALGAGLILGLTFLMPPHETAVVLRSHLILQQGRLYEPGRKAPFAGIMVELFPNGSLQSQSEIEAGA
jgi:hypothetical protein